LELHVYDFDGTLFKSPTPPAGWDIKKDWWSDSQSFGDPCVEDNPGNSMWVAPLVARAKQSISDPRVWAVLCTGRPLRSFARWRVPELLKIAGLDFDEVLLNPGTNTPQFKAASVWKLLSKYPDIQTVHVWDDDVGNLKSVETAIKRAGRVYLPHHVQKAESPCRVAGRRSKMLSPEIRIATRWATRIARLPTPESKAWDKDIKAREKHVKGALTAFKDLLKDLQPYADQAYAAHSGKSQEDLSRRGKAFVKAIKELPAVTSYLDTWVGGDSAHPAAYSWRNQVVYQARDTLLFKKALREALVEIGKQADKGFEALALAESQSAVRKVLPEELRAFLPQKIVVDVDPDGTIKRVTDRFEAEYETLGIKVKTQHTLLNRYNAIAKQVKKDMRAGDELTRMAALITAILMETGIRPGKEGNKVVQMQDGKEVDVETFGAITLGPTHVNFIKDSFVKLEFVGKKGSTNIATLTDPEIIKLLKVYVEQAKKGGSSYIFVTATGQTFTYTDLQRYFREHFAEFSPTDFRKLKATETVLAFLREEQKSLYTRIKDFVTGKKSDLKEQVVQEVVSSVQRAYEHAQTALSHEDVATTIRAYVNPEVLFRFLSRGGIEETLYDALLSGKTSLSFDPDVFIAQAMKTGATGGTTLRDLLEALEEELEIR